MEGEPLTTVIRGTMASCLGPTIQLDCMSDDEQLWDGGSASVPWPPSRF